MVRSRNILKRIFGSGSMLALAFLPPPMSYDLGTYGNSVLARQRSSFDGAYRGNYTGKMYLVNDAQGCSPNDQFTLTFRVHEVGGTQLVAYDTSGRRYFSASTLGIGQLQLQSRTPLNNDAGTRIRTSIVNNITARHADVSTLVDYVDEAGNTFCEVSYTGRLRRRP